METNISKPKINKIGDKKGLKRDLGKGCGRAKGCTQQGSIKESVGGARWQEQAEKSQLYLETTCLIICMLKTLKMFKIFKEIQKLNNNKNTQTNKELNNIVWK